MPDEEIQDMTPAKYVALLDKVLDEIDFNDRSLAHLKYIYINAHRDPGDPQKGRPASPEVHIDDCRVYKRGRKKGSVTEAGEYGYGGKHNLQGARADRGQFEAWAKGSRQRNQNSKKRG